MTPAWFADILLRFTGDHVSIEASPPSELRSSCTAGRKPGHFAIILMKSNRCRSDLNHPPVQACVTASKAPRRGNQGSESLGSTLRPSRGTERAGSRLDRRSAGPAPVRNAPDHSHAGSPGRARPGLARGPLTALRLQADHGADHRGAGLAGGGLDDPGGRRAHPARLRRVRRGDRPVPFKIGSPLVFDSVPNAREGWEHVTNQVHAAVRQLAGIPGMKKGTEFPMARSREKRP
jgi:hypothetical protein